MVNPWLALCSRKKKKRPTATRNRCCNCGEALPHRYHCQGGNNKCNICETIGHLPSLCPMARRRTNRKKARDAHIPLTLISCHLAKSPVVDTNRNKAAPSSQTAGTSMSQSFNMPAAQYQHRCNDNASQEPTCVPGKFGWTTLDNNYIPYILRDGEKYCAGRMVAFFLCKKYPSGFHTKQMYDTAWRCQRAYTTHAEAELLNEINHWHCDLMFGPQVYKAGDFLLQLQDAAEFLKFFSIVHRNANLCQDDTLDKCGVLVISGSNPIPYVVLNGIKFVPLFIFKFSVVDDKKALKLRAVELKGWDLTYLNFCYNALKYPSELMNKDTCEVINFDEVIRFYPTGTPIKFYWETAPRFEENATSTSTAASPAMPVVHLPPFTSIMKRGAMTKAMPPPLTSTGTALASSREKLLRTIVLQENKVSMSTTASQVAPVAHLTPTMSKSTGTTLAYSREKLLRVTFLQENQASKSTAASQVAPASNLPPFTSIKKRGATSTVVSPPLKSTGTSLMYSWDERLLLQENEASKSTAGSQVAPDFNLTPSMTIKKRAATSTVVSPLLKSTGTRLAYDREDLLWETFLQEHEASKSTAASQVAPASNLPPLMSIKKRGATSTVLSPPLKSTGTPLVYNWDELLLLQENEASKSTAGSQEAPASNLPPFTSIKNRRAMSSFMSPPLPTTDLQGQETSKGSQFKPSGPAEKRRRWDVEPECMDVENSGAQNSHKMWPRTEAWRRDFLHNESDESNGGRVSSSKMQTSPLRLARDQRSQVLVPEHSRALAVSSKNDVLTSSPHSPPVIKTRLH